MTDTVNVPREPTPEMLNAGANPNYPCDAIDVWRAMLAAAPKAEPVDVETEMVNEMQRGFDYKAMTANAAHRRDNPADPYSGRQCEEHVLFARDALYAHPEAPKVEQGLVGYLEGAAITDLRNGFASVTATVYSKAESGCEAIYTHPAPASDELLEAAIETVAKFDAASNTPVKDTPLGINRLRGAIAKHKGPQS